MLCVLGNPLLYFQIVIIFSFEESAISIRLGKTMHREKFMRNIEQQGCLQWSCVCIEEPFTRSNTAHSVYNEMIFDMIKQTFVTSYLELNRTRDFETWIKAPPLVVPIPG